MSPKYQTNPPKAVSKVPPGVSRRIQVCPPSWLR